MSEQKFLISLYVQQKNVKKQLRELRRRIAKLTNRIEEYQIEEINQCLGGKGDQTKLDKIHIYMNHRTRLYNRHRTVEERYHAINRKIEKERTDCEKVETSETTFTGKNSQT